MCKFIKLNRVFTTGVVKESVFNCDNIILMYMEEDYTKIITAKESFTVTESVNKILEMIKTQCD